MPAHRAPGRAVVRPRVRRAVALVRAVADVPPALEPPRWFRLLWAACMVGVGALALLGARGLVT